MSKYTVVIVESDHSEVFREVAESVHYGIIALGHESTIATVGSPASLAGGRIPIILGWNLLDLEKVELPFNSILYNLEQAGSRWLTRERLKPFKGLQFWDWHSNSAEQLRCYGHRVEHVPLGYVPEWTRIQPAKEQDIDVLFYGSMNERRHSVLRKMSERLKVIHMYRAYGAKRDEYISRSKVVLNMHYEDGGSFEIARVGYLLANRALVLSETSRDAEGFEKGVVFSKYETLTDTAHLLATASEPVLGGLVLTLNIRRAENAALTSGEVVFYGEKHNG